jgi:hypothetical protein
MFQKLFPQIGQHAFCMLLTMLLVGLGASVQAQNLTASSIDATPLVAPTNTARRISVSGVWSNGCPPVGATVASETTTEPRTLLIRLTEVLPLVACTQVLTPFRVELDYTPSAQGLLYISLLRGDGNTAATGVLGVTDGSAASANLSGTWFDAPRVGSLLMMTHSVVQPATLVGSWNLFARDGEAKWYFFHSSRRTVVPNVYEAEIYEYQSAANADCPVSACPAPGFTGKQIGTVRLTILNTRELIVEHWMSGFPANILVQRRAMVRVDL